jgi:thiamine-phosphate pyrophosphorylase
VRYKSDYDYLFLSPIFHSISKIGYGSHFTSNELQRASNEGVIDSRVVALGGVTPDKVDYLKRLGFGGVAMCGAIYRVEALDSIEYLY